jgi:hypothetical protein
MTNLKNLKKANLLCARESNSCIHFVLGNENKSLFSMTEKNERKRKRNRRGKKSNTINV